MQLLAQYHMELQLPTGTPTFQSNSHHMWTTLDLLFCDSDLTHRIQSCDASPDDHLPAADHLPIHTWIDVELNKCHTMPGHNFRNADWAKFQQTLAKNLTQSGLVLEPWLGSTYFLFCLRFPYMDSLIVCPN